MKWNSNEAQLCSFSGNEKTDFTNKKENFYLIENNQQVSHFTAYFIFLFRQVIICILLKLSLLCDSLK